MAHLRLWQWYEVVRSRIPRLWEVEQRFDDKLDVDRERKDGMKNASRACLWICVN